MIDLGAARKNAAKVRQALSSRNPKLGAAFDDLLKLDEAHRALLKEVEEMRSQRNALSQEIGKAKAAKDQARAGELLIREAGGHVTDLWNKNGFMKSGDILGSNKAIHNELVAITSTAFTPKS